MTDPFKNQRYEFDKSVSLPHTLSEYSNLSRSFSTTSNGIASSEYNARRGGNEEPDTSNKQAFIQAHIDSNRELIQQLKNNIELLFKGTSLAGQVLFFPFKVLRWQCQINSESSKHHLFPFTLVPVLYNLNYSGCVSLWKGCFSVCAYYGIKLVVESVISELSSFEKNIEDVNKSEKLYGHTALKFLSNALTTPIFTAVVFESVQSGISYENLGISDLMRETWNRITGYKYNYRTRLIPIWSLIAPTSVYFVSQHFLSFAFEKVLYTTISAVSKLLDEQKRNVYGSDQVEEEVVNEPYLKSLAQLAGQTCSILILYPMETIINRLIVQGTRTIIDNTDNGVGVIPINTRYDGFWDCARDINELEGSMGFYKGLGAFCMQALLAVVLLKAAKTAAIVLYDSEWTTKSDNNSIKNLMTSSEKFPDTAT